jgi:prepilin-type N-terminal cleavage/methylation domain-containing protein
MGSYRTSPVWCPGRSARPTAADIDPGGFSLVEILASIAIVAVLIALSLPVLSAARGQSRQTVSLSNARQLALTISAYADANDETFPATTEGAFYPAGSPFWRVNYPYWQVAETWTGVIFDLLPYHEHTDVYVSPHRPRPAFGEPLWPSSYTYSTSFVGSPALWSGDATADRTLQTPARQHMVRFPSSKALIWDEEPQTSARTDSPPDITLQRNAMMLADSSGAFRSPADATEPIENPIPHVRSKDKLHNTKLGVFGRDYE